MSLIRVKFSNSQIKSNFFYDNLNSLMLQEYLK